MQSYGIPHNARGDEEPFQVLHHHKDAGDPERMVPSAPLRGGDEDSGDPAKDDADVRNQRQDNDEQADKRGEIQTGEVKGRTDKGAVYEANQKLTSEIRDNVIVDLGEDRRDFVFQR